MAEEIVTFKPLGDKIIVRPDIRVLSEVILVNNKEAENMGTVVAVGPGRFDDGVRVPMDIKVGDVVLYSKYGGTEVKASGEEYLVLSARDILAIIEK